MESEELTCLLCDDTIGKKDDYYYTDNANCDVVCIDCFERITRINYDERKTMKSYVDNVIDKAKKELFDYPQYLKERS